MLLSLILALTIHQLPSSVSPIASVAFQETPSQIVVPATINGKDLHFIFDTGFAGDVLVDTTIDFGKQTGSETMQDFVGTFEAPVYALKSMHLGNLKLDPTGRDVIGQPGISDFGEGVHVDGLMGFSTIKDYVTQINFQDHKFNFYPSDLDISTWKPNNKTTFLVKMLPVGPRSINLPVLTPDGKTLVMALDTGNAFYATTHKDVLERVGLWPQGKVADFQSLNGVASGPVASWNKVMNNMTIFGVHVPVSYWDIIDLPAADSSSDGTVGIQFLKNFNIFFDFKRRYVWLENFDGKVANEEEGGIGIAAVFNPEIKSIEIERVSPGSPADKAGIKEGDLLLQVNDDDQLGGATFESLRKVLSGPIGSKVRLSISHEGFVKVVTVVRQALVNQ